MVWLLTHNKNSKIKTLTNVSVSVILVDLTVLFIIPLGGFFFFFCQLTLFKKKKVHVNSLFQMFLLKTKSKL